jgi:hypothetical protein
VGRYHLSKNEGAKMEWPSDHSKKRVKLHSVCTIQSFYWVYINFLSYLPTTIGWYLMAETYKPIIFRIAKCTWSPNVTVPKRRKAGGEPGRAIFSSRNLERDLRELSVQDRQGSRVLRQSVKLYVAESECREELLDLAVMMTSPTQRCRSMTINDQRVRCQRQTIAAWCPPLSI